MKRVKLTENEVMRGTQYVLEVTPEQSDKLFYICSVVRAVHNMCIYKKEQEYKENKKHLFGKELLAYYRELKAQKETEWVGVPAEATIKRMIEELMSSYEKYFKYIKDPQSKRKVGKPKYHKKTEKIYSFYTRSDKLNYNAKDNTLNISNLQDKAQGISGRVKVRLPKGETFPVEYYNTRIKFDGTQWLICFSCKQEKVEYKEELTDKVIGIDMGIKEFAITSDNEFYRNINKDRYIKKTYKKLKQLQSKIAKALNKNGGVESNNIRKLRLQKARLEKRLHDTKKNYLYEVASAVVKTKPKAVVMETLNIQGMVKNHCLARAISQMQWYKFKTIMRYKLELIGSQLIEVDRFYPSSKKCSCCGGLKKIKLSDRVYKCEKCGLEIDRDYNAALNLKAYGELQLAK